MSLLILCLPPNIHNQCFRFLFRPAVCPGENLRGHGSQALHYIDHIHRPLDLSLLSLGPRVYRHGKLSLLDLDETCFLEPSLEVSGCGGFGPEFANTYWELRVRIVSGG